MATLGKRTRPDKATHKTATPSEKVSFRVFAIRWAIGQRTRLEEKVLKAASAKRAKERIEAQKFLRKVRRVLPAGRTGSDPAAASRSENGGSWPGSQSTATWGVSL